MRRSQSTTYFGYMLRCLPLLLVVLVALSSIQTHAAPTSYDIIHKLENPPTHQDRDLHETDLYGRSRQLGAGLLGRSPEPVRVTAPTKKKPVTTVKKPITKKPITKKPITKKPITKKPVVKKPVKKPTTKTPPKNTDSCPFTPGKTKPGTKTGPGGSKISKRCASTDPFGLPFTTAEIATKFKAKSNPEDIVFYTGGVKASGRIAWMKANPTKKILKQMWTLAGVDESAFMKVKPLPAGKDEADLELEWFNRGSTALALAAEGSTEIKLLVPPGFDPTRGKTSYWTRVELPTIKTLASKPKVVTVVIDAAGNEDTAASQQLWP